MTNMFSLFTLILVTFIPDVFTLSNTVLVLSFDGFKPSYITDTETPNLFELRELGVWPDKMTTIFPSKTFVTHFSVATGAYPEAHGVYGNEMFNENGIKMFNTEEQFTANKVLIPIWIDNQNETDKERHSGVMMWPGSQFAYDGKHPTHFQEYDPNLDWKERVNKMFSWMTQGDNKANLVMAYFEDSSLSYDKNKKNSDLKSHITRVDELVGYIGEKLKDSKMEDKVDMIIMSDHGTQEILGTGVLFIEDYIDETKSDIIVDGPLVYVRPKNSVDFDSIRQNISIKPHYQDGITIYIKDNLPSNWYMKDSKRMDGIIILVTSPPYTFYKKNEFTEAKGSLSLENFAVEVNGYENDEESMNTLFMGIGPSFKSNENTQEDLELIDVYPLLRSLLKLKIIEKDEYRKTKITAKIKSILK